ncbi:hypothetical protein ACFXKG_21275 [Streptomyces sp. NPDC059255]|uniref:hypothetical protein n=1 Tax=Streptomyces sp. NPDC059255 TaxID=3346793 RepID=UPI0036BB0205
MNKHMGIGGIVAELRLDVTIVRKNVRAATAGELIGSSPTGRQSGLDGHAVYLAPRDGADDVLARIQAAGVNLLDSSSVTGLQGGPSFRRPLILGIADFQDDLAVEPATLTMAEAASVFCRPDRVAGTGRAGNRLLTCMKQGLYSPALIEFTSIFIAVARDGVAIRFA